MTTLEHVSIVEVYNHLTGEQVNPRGYSVNVNCPIHLERNPSCSLNLRDNVFYCHKCKVGGSAAAMIRLSRFADLNNKDGYRAAYAMLRDLHLIEPQQRDTPAAVYQPRTELLEANHRIYPFHDRTGATLYDEVRIEGLDPVIFPEAIAAGLPEDEARAQAQTKRIFQRRHLPKGRWYTSNGRYVFYDDAGAPVPYGPNDLDPISLPTHDRSGQALREPSAKYLYNLRGLPSLLYRLPVVLKAAREAGVIILNEGPKKASTVAKRADLTATSLAGGAKAEFTLEHALDFSGASGLLIFSDSDEAGRDSALLRARIAAHIVPDVRIIDFFSDDSKRDVMQWLELQGRARAEELRATLQILANSAARFSPDGMSRGGDFPLLTTA